MDDLITWLRARIGEDEQAAAEMRENEKFWADCGEPHDHRIRLRQWEFTPDRLLREVEAKRQLLEEHQDSGVGVCGTCVDWLNDHLKWPCRTVRLLALPFSDRPGYREEWRP